MFMLAGDNGLRQLLLNFGRKIENIASDDLRESEVLSISHLVLQRMRRSGAQKAAATLCTVNKRAEAPIV
ncbi:hypothetical protein [Sinorhizobium sp. BJ1]|uniref:hypothetical protein n=1 Tax=Sinorhizobium sp. BJ1 TaxID=2035455 RepID=UPI000BE83D11|nr:hypothetical protein [Sinorhizobium sp. BJ1]PDT80796.1 hypothetical protein CO676_26085 [Sinorhizobium sp. BJ1]